MSMSKYELRVWLCGITWLLLMAVAFPEEFRGYFGTFVRLAFCFVIGWNIGGAWRGK